MPALANPRHEAFAQALVASLSGDRKGKNTAKAAYLAAGYKCLPGHSAEVLASRLLRKVEPIAARVAELQADQVPVLRTPGATSAAKPPLVAVIRP